jgi:hypothetical protein
MSFNSHQRQLISARVKGVDSAFAVLDAMVQEMADQHGESVAVKLRLQPESELASIIETLENPNQ